MARFNLPDINFLEVDAEEYESLMVTTFENLMKGVTLSEYDPRRITFKTIAMILAMMGNNIDFTGKQSLLAYAVDNYLDHKGISKGVPRLDAKAATTTIRFIVNPQEPFTIPAGTRISTGDVEFAIDKDTYVTTEITEIDISATCTETGEIGNGYLPNQITQIVDNDQLPWVVSAANITKSEGGLEIEDDDSYAERVRASNEGFSTAGPELSYEYFAKSSNQNVIDVKVVSNNPSEIEIIPLMKNGELPTESEQAEILAAVSQEKIRPLTDNVSITLPEQVPYDLSITYFIPQESSGLQSSITQRVDEAISEYVLWQKGKLGRGIDPSELYGKLQEAGAKRITIVPNEYVSLEHTQIAKENVISVDFGGFIND